jgi:hypothetical protein
MDFLIDFNDFFIWILVFIVVFYDNEKFMSVVFFIILKK